MNTPQKRLPKSFFIDFEAFKKQHNFQDKEAFSIIYTKLKKDNFPYWDISIKPTKMKKDDKKDGFFKGF
jgi:hypothetical protein